jgi:predicted transcriptional regulator
MSKLIINDTALLPVSKADETINLCISEERSDADVYEALMFVIRSFREIKSSSANAKQMQSSFDNAKYISSSLRKQARKKKALRYYYFGMYQAKLEQLYDEFLHARSISKQQAVENRKYFSQIMKILYDQEVVRQCDLAKSLHVERANLSREMSLLALAGLVEERKTGKLKLYNLSALGYDYCNKFYLTKGKIELSKNTADERIKTSTVQHELDYFDDTKDSKTQMVFVSLPQPSNMSDCDFCYDIIANSNHSLDTAEFRNTIKLVEVNL